MIKKEKILFITNFFPSYRKSIWKKLINNKNSDVIFYFDPIQNEDLFLMAEKQVKRIEEENIRVKEWEKKFDEEE